ncbi:nucleoporin Nup43-like [Mytilus galloprovincialis]|uniref:nucleoporin Nup43-like n=1 Tax=Mytilus galloprovincialis TaxID=29158 RepID=UPI003F7B723B
MADIRATFVSQKISKIRWKNIVKNSLEGPDTFVTGSWDDEENKVCLWKVNREKKFDEGDGRGTEGDVDNDPIPICEASHIGDVTGLEFISEDHIVSSSSSGTVTLYKHHTSSQTLGNSHQWERLHHHCNKPCHNYNFRHLAIPINGRDFIITICLPARKSSVNFSRITIP